MASGRGACPPREPCVGRRQAPGVLVGSFGDRVRSVVDGPLTLDRAQGPAKLPPSQGLVMVAAAVPVRRPRVAVSCSAAAGVGWWQASAGHEAHREAEEGGCPFPVHLPWSGMHASRVCKRAQESGRGQCSSLSGQAPFRVSSGAPRPGGVNQRSSSCHPCVVATTPGFGARRVARPRERARIPSWRAS